MSIAPPENARNSPYPSGLDDTIQFKQLSMPVPAPLSVTIEAPIARKRSGSGEVGGNEIRKSLRGSIAIVKGTFTCSKHCYVCQLMMIRRCRWI